jgi:hypothetical protein
VKILDPQISQSVVTIGVVLERSNQVLLILHMPIENEVLRRKREREFQARMLASIEKPKPNRLLTLINAPISLWLLSAIALSFGAAVYQTRNQCSDKSEALIANQFRTRNEIDRRIYYFKEAVLSTKSPKQLQDILRKRKSIYADLRAKGLWDLLEDQLAIVNYLPIDDRIKLAQKLAQLPPQHPQEPPIAFLAADAEINDIDDETFKDLKTKVTDQTPWLPNATLFVPQCSIVSVVRLTISGGHDYLRAIPFDQP